MADSISPGTLKGKGSFFLFQPTGGAEAIVFDSVRGTNIQSGVEVNINAPSVKMSNATIDGKTMGGR